MPGISTWLQVACWGVLWRFTTCLLCFHFTEHVYAPTLLERGSFPNIGPRKITKTDTLGTDPPWSAVHTNKEVLHTCTNPSVSRNVSTCENNVRLVLDWVGWDGGSIQIMINKLKLIGES